MQNNIYCRDGEPFQRRVPIFRHLESQNIWRAKTKNKEYRAILIAYNISFFVQTYLFHLFSCGQQSKVPTRVGSRRQRCDAICNRGSRGLSFLSGVWGGGCGAPVANGFWKKYLIKIMELVFINCLPC